MIDCVNAVPRGPNVGRPCYHCADGQGHPVWSLTFMVHGRKHVERIPDDWVEWVGQPAQAGRQFQEVVREIFAANAQLWRNSSGVAGAARFPLAFCAEGE